MTRYSQFFLMIATSTAMIYLNTYQMYHLFFSETRLYMALYMGAAMAVIKLLLMLKMYTSATKNSIILVTAAIIFMGALWLVRSQSTVETG